MKVTLSKYNNLSFREVKITLKSNELKEIEKWWNEYSKEKSFLFNGEIIAIREIINKSGKIDICWFKSKYSHYIQNSIKSARIMYCSILITTEDNKLLIVKTSIKTATNRKLMLPGGNIELENGKLNLEICKKNALRELEEEVGIILKIEDLELWRIKEGGKNNELGIFFKSKWQMKEEKINKVFNSHFSYIEKNNLISEISEIYFVKDKTGLNKIKNAECVDYLYSVLNDLKKEIEPSRFN